MHKYLKKIKFALLRILLIGIIITPYHAALATDGYDMCIVPTKGGNPEVNQDYVGDVTSILYGNCDPYANEEEDNLPNVDGTAKLPHQQSCSGQNITVADYMLTINYNSGILGNSGTHQIRPFNGQSFDISAPIGSATFRAEVVGDMACVWGSGIITLYASATAECGVVVNGAAFNDNNKRTNTDIPIPFGINTNGLNNPIDSSMPLNCIPIPPPENPPLQDIDWGSFIAPVCIEYDQSSSQFKYSDDSSRSFTGVVVECIEDTISNLFQDTTVNNVTLFGQIQDNLQGVIRAILVLYVVLFGYSYIYHKKGLSLAEWSWTFVRLGMVIYFTTGAGATQLLPILQVTSKSLSLIVMEAASGDMALAQAAQTQLTTDSDTLAAANLNLIAARRSLAQDPGNASKESAVTAALAVRQNALTAYNITLSDSKSYGYRYCDFRDINNYASGKEYMRLWDMVDCKISKFLGIGSNIDAPGSPYLLAVSFASIFTHIGIGLLIFILTIIISLFLILIIIRIVHIYIMATIGLVLLMYMSPLIIPAVLFDYTKYIFNGWLQQIIAFTIQPIILFAFLAFMLSAFDMVIYGGNHYFVPMTTAHEDYENLLCKKYKNSVLTSRDVLCSNSAFQNAFEVQNVVMNHLKCDDPSAIGCILQDVSLTKSRGNHNQFGINKYNGSMSYKQAADFFMGLIQLLLVSYIAYAVLQLVEKMSKTLLNAVSGPADLSGAPTASPQQLTSAVASTAWAKASAMGKSKLKGKAKERLADKDTTSRKSVGS